MNRLTLEFNQKPFEDWIKNIKKTSTDNNFYSDIFEDVANYIDTEAQNGIAKVTKELSRSFKTVRNNSKELEFGYDVPYAAYNERGQRADGSRKIKNRTPPGKDKWFERVLKNPDFTINRIEEAFFNKLNI